MNLILLSVEEFIDNIVLCDEMKLGEGDFIKDNLKDNISVVWWNEKL